MSRDRRAAFSLVEILFDHATWRALGTRNGGEVVGDF
jgi:hypothetical protein